MVRDNYVDDVDGKLMTQLSKIYFLSLGGSGREGRRVKYMIYE